MPERSFASYLTESLEQIARHVPDVYALVARTLGARRVQMEVGAETLSLAIDDGRVALGPALPSAELRAVTTRAAIVRLARGRCTLEQSALNEQLQIWGSVEDLAAGVDALSAYLNGAARCPELRALMDEFRKEAAHGGES